MLSITDTTAKAEPINATGPKWIVSASTDVISAFAWLPVFVVAHFLNGAALRTWASLVFLFSLVHQAITPLLLATDRPTRARHRVIYTAGIPVVAFGSWLLLQAGMGWVAFVAAGWNLIHTLRQRYGIVRLYGSQAGQLRRPIEQGLIFGPFLGAAGLAIWLPGTLDSIDRLGFGGINAEIVDGITSISRLAPVVLLASVLWVGWTLRSLHRDRAHRPPSNTKQLYLGSYYLSLVCAVFDPAAGVMPSLRPTRSNTSSPSTPPSKSDSGGKEPRSTGSFRSLGTVAGS